MKRATAILGFAVVALSAVVVTSRCPSNRMMGKPENIKPIAAPARAAEWEAELVKCLGRGTTHPNAKWYVADLSSMKDPRTGNRMAGITSFDSLTITLDYSIVALPEWNQMYKAVIKHEMTHLNGWVTQHQVIPPLGWVDYTEPREWFKRECGNIP